MLVTKWNDEFGLADIQDYFEYIIKIMKQLVLNLQYKNMLKELITE